jgi:hypothetical protein
LAVTATNILFEFDVVSLNKPAEQIARSGKQAEAKQRENSGLDPVLAKLSSEITKKLFVN